MEDLKVINVRAMINLFEDNCRNETEQLLNRKLSKSFGGLSFSDRKYKSNTPNDNDILYELNKRLTSVCYRLKDYKEYDKETHIAFQEELIEVMTILVDIDVTNNTVMYKKKEAMYDVKACFNELSSRLPGPSSDNGDFTYKPFSWKRANSIANVGPNAKDSSKTLDNQNDYIPFSKILVKPKRTQSVIERYTKNIQRPSINESNKLYYPRSGKLSRSSDSLASPVNQSPEFVTGRADGIWRSMNSSDSDRRRSMTSPSNEGVVYESLSSPSSFSKGEPIRIVRPMNSSLRSDDVSLNAKNLQRSSPEISDVVKRPVVTLGRSESARRWTYGELRGRRRPVSLGGTVVTLNSPKDIISSLTFSHDYSQSTGRISDPRLQDDALQDTDQATVFTEYEELNDRPEDENALQSVQILKRMFELKSGETENQEQEKLLNAQEDERRNFREYVQRIEESLRAEECQNETLIRENSDDSSTNTLVGVETEDGNFVGNKSSLFSRTSSIVVDEVDGLNSPVLLHGGEREVDEIIITSSVSEDLEEVGSLGSEQSVYLDPVD